MRKRLPILIIFFIVIIFIYLLLHILKKEHQYNYDILIDGVNYKIEEKYNYTKGVHNYDFIVVDEISG